MYAIVYVGKLVGQSRTVGGKAASRPSKAPLLTSVGLGKTQACAQLL